MKLSKKILNDIRKLVVLLYNSDQEIKNLNLRFGPDPIVYPPAAYKKHRQILTSREKTWDSLRQAQTNYLTESRSIEVYDFQVERLIRTGKYESYEISKTG